jgi:L-fuconolactonase
MLLDRRSFVQQTVAVLAAAGFGRAAEPKGADVFPIIDTHQHLWDIAKFRLPWLEREPKLAQSYLMEDYKRATRDLTAPAKVVKTIYMEVDLAPEQQQAEAEYVLEICKSGNTPMVAAVISGRPAADGFAKYIAAFKGNPYIKGVRQVLHGPTTPARYCLDPNFIKGIRLLGELGMSFDLCFRPGELLDAAKLIDACPDTRFILDHCGNGNVQATDRTQWQKDIAAVALKKNVVCKVSGIVASAKPGQWTADDLAPIVNHTLNTFGPERVMFGGDWPVCTLAATFKQWFEALRTIVHDRKDEDQRRLFHDNAVRVYGLRA